MPANYRPTTALAFQATTFYELLDTARHNAGHSWVDVARATGVGLDTFRRLHTQPPGRPEQVTPRLNQYLSMAAYIRRHIPHLNEGELIGAAGILYTEATDSETTETPA